MKYRIRITQVVTLGLLIAAKPYCWALFAIGMAIAAVGESLRIWSAGNLYKDKKLAINGPYKMVRNPLYVGSFLMATGLAVSCFNPEYIYRSLALILIVLLGFKFIYSLQVQAEEKHLANLFTEDYAKFKAAVPPYMPKLSRFGDAVKHNNFSFKQALYNKEYEAVLGLIAVAVFLALKIIYPAFVLWNY